MRIFPYIELSFLVLIMYVCKCVYTYFNEMLRNLTRQKYRLQCCEM